MKITVKLLAKLGLLPLLAILSVGSVSAADGSREDDSGETDGQGCQARERLRQRHQEVLPYGDAR